MQTNGQGDTLRSQAAWTRGLFMLLFLIAFHIAQWLLTLVTVVQFVWLLAAGEPNRFLQGFGGSLSAWLAEAARFMTCATDEKPFPWRPWPAAG
jgi:hypothetical protein